MVEGGPLTVFKDVINAFSSIGSVEVICLVHSAELFKGGSNPNVEFFEYPDVKASWAKRCWFEYVTSKKLSMEISADIWLSMHDMSPNVNAPHKFVYCHNSSPFYKATFHDARFDIKFYLFTLFYRTLYRINIKTNDSVIVQQSRLVEPFLEMGAREVIVAAPSHAVVDNAVSNYNRQNDEARLHLLYPALSRTFKNFELLIESLKYLKEYYPSVYNSIQLTLTIDDSSGRYARHLINQSAGLEAIHFVGRLSPQELAEYYGECDVVIFPSKLETWGLPISEAKAYAKPIILADLPYAHETLGCYDSACFVDVNDFQALALKLKSLIDGDNIFNRVEYVHSDKVLRSWDELAANLLMRVNGSLES